MEQGMIDWVRYDENDKSTHPIPRKKLLICAFYRDLGEECLLTQGRFKKTNDIYGRKRLQIVFAEESWGRRKGRYTKEFSEFSSVYWAYLYPAPFDPKYSSAHAFEIERIAKTAEKQKPERIRLKDKVLQMHLDEISGGMFSDALDASAKEGEGQIVVKINSRTPMEMTFSRGDVETSFFDPNSWNRFPDVTPPHDQLLECLCVYKDGEHGCIELLRWNDKLKVFVKDGHDLWGDEVDTDLKTNETCGITMYFRLAPKNDNEIYLT